MKPLWEIWADGKPTGLIESNLQAATAFITHLAQVRAFCGEPQRRYKLKRLES